MCVCENIEPKSAQNISPLIVVFSCSYIWYSDIKIMLISVATCKYPCYGYVNPTLIPITKYCVVITSVWNGTILHWIRYFEFEYWMILEFVPIQYCDIKFIIISPLIVVSKSIYRYCILMVFLGWAIKCHVCDVDCCIQMNEKCHPKIHKLQNLSF